jgi:uncharacterized membrane protein YeiB
MTVHDFDRPAASLTTSGTPRLVALDVVRAVALIGVVAMNYVGAMVRPGLDRGFWGRVFDPYTGPLSTRFAATFVLVAGIGVTLLTERARRSDDPEEIRRARLRLARRGLLLYLVGYVLDFTWPGTILFYYGAYFLLATVLFRLATRWLVVIGISAGVTASSIATWTAWKRDRFEPVTWLGFDRIESIQDLVVRTFLDYTHPIFPWIAFLCAGMIVGRHLSTLATWRWRVASISAAVVVLIYAVATVLDRTSSRDGVIVAHLTSLQTYDRGLPYLASTLGIAIVAFLAISAIAERWSSTSLVVHLQRAGQLTLTLYLLHVLTFSLAVNQFGWIGGDSLSTALWFAGGFWLVGLAAASWWHHRIGRGPAEAVYRVFGG